MHVDVRNPRAAVFPSLAAISAEQVAAMLQQHPDEILIVGMDKDVTHVGELDAAQPRRHIPFLFYVIGKIEHTVQRFPSLAGILAAKQADRTDAHVDNPFVVWINSESANVAVHDFAPGFSGVFGTVPAVERDGGEDHLRLLTTADQVLERFALEELADGGHRRTFWLHDFQSAVMGYVVAQRFHKASSDY